MRTFFLWIFPISALCWGYECWQLLFATGYEMHWINQLLSAFTSLIACITWWFQLLDEEI